MDSFKFKKQQHHSPKIKQTWHKPYQSSPPCSKDKKNLSYFISFLIQNALSQINSVHRIPLWRRCSVTIRSLMKYCWNFNDVILICTLRCLFLSFDQRKLARQVWKNSGVYTVRVYQMSKTTTKVKTTSRVTNLCLRVPSCSDGELDGHYKSTASRVHRQ